MNEIKAENLTGKNDHFFDTEHLKSDLKGRSVRGGTVTVAAQGVRFFLQICSTAVLARLLTPQDYGLITMVTAVTGFVMMFKDMGLSMATVQKANINHAQISTLFWMNVIFSLGLMLVTAALAPAIAWFYNEPRLTWITLVLASAFIFGGFTVQHQALLRRQMRFGSLALIQIISLLVGILTAIIAAFYGMDYWSLVLMQLVTAITSAIAVWVACGWRPGMPVRRSGVRKMLAFGGHLTGFNFVNYFSRNADKILIGKFIGSDALGLYAKAYGLFMMPISQIRTPLNQVAIPVLSSLQNQPERYVKYYQSLIDIMATLTIPLTLYCAIEADFLIQTILGQQWLAAVPVFRILVIAALIQPVASTRGLVLISHGFSGRYFYWGLFHAILVVVSFLVGLPFGIEGVATAYAIANYVILIPSLFYCFQETPVTVSLFMRSLASPAIAGLLAAACVIVAKYVVEGDSLLFHGICLAIFIFIYSGLSMLRESVRETASMILNRAAPIRTEKDNGATK
ncbi:MAG: lipopolysaccharide biosynthesis protein [Planctomycetota bacterium]|jgi:PST family polysaccharide transporter